MKNQSENKVYTLAEVLGKHTIAEDTPSRPDEKEQIK